MFTPDCFKYGTFRTGERAEGATFSLQTFSPTKARWKVWDEADKANKLIATYATTQHKVIFIDITNQLLGADGKPNKDLFVWDGLHLNADGYAIWTSIIKPILEKDLGY